MTDYHVRVHYRTGNKLARRVSWFRVQADNQTDAANRAIQKVINRKTNSGQVEIETIEARKRI